MAFNMTSILRWTGGNPMTVSDFLAVAESLKNVPPGVRVDIKVEPGSQREPGGLTITVNLR